MIHEEITRDIIGAAMEVLNELKPGLDEKLYERGLILELQGRGHSVDQQREFPVHYRGQYIGKMIPDMIVDGKVIADPKVVTAFNDSHLAQMLGYLKHLWVEFGNPSQLQEFQARMEACCKRNKKSARNESNHR